jgi:hypothetical protein
MHSEKRSLIRFPITGSIMIQSEAEGAVKSIYGELLDLSFKGSGFCTRESLMQGSHVKFLLLNINLGLNLAGEAKVVYEQKIQHKGSEIFKYGIQFSHWMASSKGHS